MKRYDAYKNSGVQWIGEVPRHWNIRRNKDILKECKTLVGDDSSHYTLLSLTKQGVIVRDLTENKGKFPKEFNTYKVIEVGDMIFCLFDVDETPRTIGLSNHNGMITGAYNVFKTKNVDPNYILYYYVSIDDVKGLRPLYKGLRKVIPFPTFMSAKVLTPPHSEQQSIVAYLKDKTSKIDQYVTERERERELLESLKQSEIANVVTKGLNPNAPMKDSGIPWIGMIPEHWEVERLSGHISFSKGLPITKANLVQEGVPVISYGQIHSKENNSINLKASLLRFVSPKYKKTNPQCLLNKYDFVFADTSEDYEGAGNFVLNDANYDVFAGYHTVVARLNKQDYINPIYLAHLLNSSKLRNQIRSKVDGVKVYTISKHIIKSLLIVIPPMKEQLAIVDYLNKRINKIDQYIADLQTEIDYLKEFKQRLISDVVTGQICVAEPQKGEHL